MGVLLGQGRLALVKIGSTYALHATGTVSIIGVDGVTITGTVTARVNTTGLAIDEALSIPGGTGDPIPSSSPPPPRSPRCPPPARPSQSPGSPFQRLRVLQLDGRRPHRRRLERLAEPWRRRRLGYERQRRVRDRRPGMAGQISAGRCRAYRSRASASADRFTVAVNTYGPPRSTRASRSALGHRRARAARRPVPAHPGHRCQPQRLGLSRSAATSRIERVTLSADGTTITTVASPPST